MLYRPLGRTGVKVSALCLGTVKFGKPTPDEECYAIIDRAIDAGGAGCRDRPEAPPPLWSAHVLDAAAFLSRLAPEEGRGLLEAMPC